MKEPTRSLVPAVVCTTAALIISATAFADEREASFAVGAEVAVASDHPLASQVGIDILEQGGNAADAAVAVGLTLGVVNPFASGLGGGGFLLWHDAETGEVTALNFREVAPALAHRDMYLVDGVADEELSRTGALAVGVPGELAGWVALHERYGALPWEDVVEPARRIAADGYEAGSLIEDRLRSDQRLTDWPELEARYTVDGELAREGDLLIHDGLGELLSLIQTDPMGAFYEGEIADDIVASMEAGDGLISLEDLQSYEVQWLDPVVFEYRGYTIYGMPLPSSGGLVLAEILGALEGFALDRLGWNTAVATHIVAQAMGHAFSDRARFMGDASFVDVPIDELLSDARREAIEAGILPHRTLRAEEFAPLVENPDDHGTSHFSIVDASGNAVAVTTTINTSFGSHVTTPRFGLVLNNEMDDFAAQPGVPNAFGLVGTEANAVQAGKRPLSSMSPTIVTEDGSLVGTLGGSGGPMIITGTLLALIQLIDFDATPAEAVSSDRFHFQWLPFLLFTESSDEAVLEDLDELGYPLDEREFGSAVQAIWRFEDGWMAASDPRKHGVPAAR